MRSLFRALPVVLLTITISGTPLYAESQRTIVNLRGDEVIVPCDAPSKQDLTLQRMLSVDDRLIVFLYSGPEFQLRVDYAETYNLSGELLEIAWYDPTAGLKRAQDISLGDPKATRPARILAIVTETRNHARRPGTLTGMGYTSKSQE